VSDIFFRYDRNLRIVKSIIENLCLTITQENIEVIVPTFRILANFFSHEASAITQRLLEKCNILKYLPKFLQKNTLTFLQKECCWMLSNIICTERPIAKKVLDFRSGEIIKRIIAIAVSGGGKWSVR
jgi:hypothetical protein